MLLNIIQECSRMWGELFENELLMSDSSWALWWSCTVRPSSWPIHALSKQLEVLLRKITLFKYLSACSLIHQIQICFPHEYLFVVLSTFCFLFLCAGLRLCRRSAVTIWRFCWINMAAFLCVGPTPSTRCAPITPWVAPECLRNRWKPSLLASRWANMWLRSRVLKLAAWT